MDFSCKLGVAVISPNYFKLEHLPGCPCSDKSKQIGNRATGG